MDAAEAVEQKSELELFAEFFELQNNQNMSEVQQQFVENMIRDLRKL